MMDSNSLDFDITMQLLIDESDLLAYGNATEMFSDENKNNLESPYKEIKNIYKIKAYDKKQEYWLKCIINFNTSTYQRNIAFNYDIVTKRIENIDKNFQE